MKASAGLHSAAMAVLLLFGGAPATAQRRIPKDLSGVRGFNYQSAPTTGHAEHWLRYSAAETERDFDFARRVMPTLQYAPGVSMNKEKWTVFRDYVADLVATIGIEPRLAFWDVSNEPDCCALPPTAANRTRMEHAVYMARMFHELDPVTPVTIGAAFSDNESPLTAHEWLSWRRSLHEFAPLLFQDKK